MSDEKDLQDLQAKYDELMADNMDYEASFDLRYLADMRAIARWRAESPDERKLTLPDHADLCVWLLMRLDVAEGALRQITTDPCTEEVSCSCLCVDRLGHVKDCALAIARRALDLLGVTA